ncbi:MAG: hypothetical protein ABI877_15460 [Gemmatimonadaceae bacterium]
MRTIHTVLAVAVVTLAACGKKPEAANATADSTTANMNGMGMGMAMQGMQMAPMMRSHLDSVASMQPAQMAAMMPSHQELTTRMMDAMGADMRGKNMQPDAAWTALGDSLRRDLDEMRGLSGDSLKSRMMAHVARMQRMMVMHEGMMHM